MAVTVTPPPRAVAASVSDHRVIAPPEVVMFAFADTSVAALKVIALLVPVTVCAPFIATAPAVDSKVAAPVVLQAFGSVNDFVVVMLTEPPADKVAKLVKMSPLVELFDVIEIEPVPDVVILLLAVAK